MTKTGAVPPIIIKALTSAFSYILVVKGETGTGKSLFVQELLRCCPDSFLILSNTENIDIYTTLASKEIRNWNENHVITKFCSESDISQLADASFKEQLEVLVGESVPEFSLAIFDSCSDLFSNLNLVQQLDLVCTLIESARKEKKKLVLLCDNAEFNALQTSLSRIADGIVTLEKVRSEVRIFRKLTIEKMRGFPLDQDVFLFTLYDGRFTYIPWYKHQYPAITIEREPIPDPSQDRISTGNQSLDEIIGGGYKKESLTLIEVDRIAAPHLETIYIPFLSNQLILEKSIVIVLPDGWPLQRFVHGLSYFVGKDRITKQIVFFGRQSLRRGSNIRNIDEDPWKMLQEIRYEANRLVRELHSEVIEFIALDTLENRFGVDTVKGIIAEMTASLPNSATTTVAILSRQQELASTGLPHTMHLVLEEKFGVLGLYGITPRTGFLAITPRLSKGFLDYELLPII